MPEHAGGLGYENEDMVLFPDTEFCPRCGSDKAEEIEPNGRGKDRRCGNCGVLWNHKDPENWSIIGL